MKKDPKVYPGTDYTSDYHSLPPFHLIPCDHLPKSQRNLFADMVVLAGLTVYVAWKGLEVYNEVNRIWENRPSNQGQSQKGKG